jgi:hypothetical protein
VADECPEMEAVPVPVSEGDRGAMGVANSPSDSGSGCERDAGTVASSPTGGSLGFAVSFASLACWALSAEGKG